ncbi:retrovirus-related Pol polyprotein from transposon 412, partial [Trichonephila inaurata madagascariensis]
MEVKINPQEKNTVSDTSTNKDTLSKEKASENENEETKLIRNDFAHYVGTPIDADLREQILKLGPYQPEGNFQKHAKGRSFSSSYYSFISKAGQRIQRKWLCYSTRLHVAYRQLLIEDVLDTLQEAKVYSTLDLRNGFFHVDVDEDCRKYTSFIVPDRQFEFNKVPFGLSTSPGIFQRYVSSIFRDLTRKGIVISYLDDLVIPAKDEKEGLEKLKTVFEVAKKYGLEIKFKKCQFLKTTIEFLGHVVENGTIKPSTAKTQAV